MFYAFASPVLVDCSSEVNASLKRAIPVLFNAEVGVILEPALELLEQAHPLVRAENVLFDGGIDQRRLELRFLVEPMNGNDREKLSQRPVIEQRLKHRKVADVLIGQLDVERAQILRNFVRVHVRDDVLQLLGNLPVQRLDAGLDV